MKIRLLCAITLGLLFARTPASASEDVKVPFIFTEDEKVSSAHPESAITTSPAIRANDFVSAPMTRLDYIMMRMESRLMDRIYLTSIESKLREAFDPGYIAGGTDPDVEGRARYSSKTGRITAGYRIVMPGRPKRPLSKITEDLTDYLEIVVPMRLNFDQYINRFFGVLTRADSKQSYDVELYSEEHYDAAKVIAKSLVHQIVLDTYTDNETVTHRMIATRNAAGGKISFYKFSTKLGRDDGK